ncbi:DUF4301 family protein [Thermodesulfobacteriota bacterium]
MNEFVFSKEDLDEINARGTGPEKVMEQIQMFRRGFPPSMLVKPCTIGDGILDLEKDNIPELISSYSEAEKSGRCMKFVPASGAASRMFKLLLYFYNRSVDIQSLMNEAESGDSDSRDIMRFIDEISQLPFYDDLERLMSGDNLGTKALIEKGDIKEILGYILFEKGLNLSNIPKGLIPFHRYVNYSRTPFEEHLVEACEYTKASDGSVTIHFTVSPEHEESITEYIDSVKKEYEKNGTRINVSYSFQKPSTDTIAVDLENNPFRDKDNNLLFRPGGHGALIENLSEFDGDIVFIKNIDNIVQDRYKDITYTYKKALGGYLISLQKEIFGFLKKLNDEKLSDDSVHEILNFVSDRLSLIPPENIQKGDMKEKKEYLISSLNRPLRVCGMVRNVGEPGGGPFWVEQPGKGISAQIVETSQVDMNSPEQKKIFQSATHFNPVDLVCGLRDFSGKPFDLKKFIDHDTGFISRKSKDGRDLKALELPGLWNGSMAYWNTVFVEVPAITFNPVKTVFDLLREEHQPA